MCDGQSIVIHSGQDLPGQVVAQALLIWWRLDTKVGRPPSTRDESTQLLSGLKGKHNFIRHSYQVKYSNNQNTELVRYSNRDVPTGDLGTCPKRKNLGRKMGD